MISIVLPTWNRSNSLRRVIFSVLQQTYKKFELLICDDGSTDNSKQIVLDLAKKDNRVSWIEGVHTGLPSIPRNKGISLAKGEYVAFIDSDDIWNKDKLKNQIDLMKNSTCLASCTNATQKNNKNYSRMLIKYNKNILDIYDLLLDNKVITSSCLVSKSLLNRLEGFPTDKSYKAIEDYFLWLKVATKTDFLFINKPLVEYSDNSADSVRKSVIGGEDQRKMVLREFLKWSITNPALNFNYLKTLKNTFSILYKI